MNTSVRIFGKNGLFFLIYKENNLMECGLDFRRKGITNDKLAATISSPKPASVSRLLAKIDVILAKSGEEFDSLNLSENDLRMEGAIQVLKYVVKHFPSLKQLNLKSNNIKADLWGDLGDEFDESLKAVLNLPYVKSVNLKNNLSTEWYKYVCLEFPNNLVQKIDINC